jgi:curved DNA-binding protein CbpA
MASIHTHYDNLKVTRNAPPEVIRAAYKTLSQKYHPDRHPGNADAERVMALINMSYQVLSDPVQRAEHDRSIDRQEAASQTAGPSVSRPPAAQGAPGPTAQRRSHYQEAALAPPQPPSNKGASLVSHMLRYWALYGIAALITWSLATEKPSAPPVGPKPYQAIKTPAAPAFVRPDFAPNSQPWPVAAGYVKGYQQLHANGLSTVTVDNSKNDSEVFVKLVSLDGAQAYPVRQFYIPAFGRFTLNKVTAGSYDVRYRDLGTGGLSRSEAITLNEVHDDEGAQFSNFTMTLYKVKNGNMQTYGLLDAEF